MSDTNGGFEVDGPVWKRLVCASGSPTDTSENSRLRQGEWLFSPLYSHKTCAYRCGLQLMTCSGMCVVFRVTEEIVGQVLSYQTCDNCGLHVLWPTKWGLFKPRVLVVSTLCFDLRHAHILFLLVNDKLFCLLLAELERLSDHFQLLSALPATTKSSLLQNITKVMEAQSAVSSLQSVVSGAERLCQHRDVLYQPLLF